MNGMIMLLNKEIKVFKKDIADFCNNNNIEVSLYNFLSYKEKDKKLPKNIGRFLAVRMPKLYIASSKEFWRAVELLPSDFKSDIIKQIKKDKLKVFLSENFEIVDYLKEIQGKNYFNLLKKEKHDNKNIK